MILVDSNILIDIFNRDPDWFEWSAANLKHAGMGAYLFVNPIVVGEVGWQFESYEEFGRVMATLLISVEPLGPDAAHVAGVVYQKYRQRRQGDAPRIPLADFFIGGHAQHGKAMILTRDPRFYRAYFPDVPLITPDV